MLQLTNHATNEGTNFPDSALGSAFNTNGRPNDGTNRRAKGARTHDCDLQAPPFGR